MKGQSKLVITIVIIAIIGGAAATLYTRGGQQEREKEPIKIGILQDLTGGLSPWGKIGKPSAITAIEQINKDGGINGRMIEYKVEDGATDASTGLEKFKKLVDRWGADFVVGPCNSGTDTAIMPVAKQKRVPYFAFGTARSITGKNGNRWIFRIIPNMKANIRAIGESLPEDLHNFGGVGADYEWGHSVIEEGKLIVEDRGDTWLQSQFVPSGTSDFIPVLKKFNAEKLDVLFAGFYASDATRLSRHMEDLGFSDDFLLAGQALHTGQSPQDFGGAEQQAAVRMSTYHPRRNSQVPEELRSYDADFREAVGVTMDGHWKDSGKPSAIDYGWLPYEHVYLIKKGIEKSGWKPGDSYESFIKALEGITVEGGKEFPQGGFRIRAEDHQGFPNIYLTQIKDGQFSIVKRISGEKTTYPPNVDYTTEDYW